MSRRIPKADLASRSNKEKFELPFQKKVRASSWKFFLEQWNLMQSVEILTWSHCFEARIRQHSWLLKCWLIRFGSDFAYERSESQNRQMKHTKIINEMHNLRSFSSIRKYHWPEQMQLHCCRACHLRWFSDVDACSVWFKAKFEIQILKHENNLYILFALSFDLNGQLIKTWLSDDQDVTIRWLSCKSFDSH